MAKCGMCMGRGSYDDPPWGIRVCVLCHGAGHDDPNVELWDRKGNVQHNAVERFGEARAQMKRIEQEHAAKSEFQREVEKLGNRECRHCGWLCMPNDAPAKTFYPLEPQAAKQQAEPTNGRLRKGMQEMMARLTFLLDEDQFAEMEQIAKSAGVEPEAVQQQAEPGADERATELGDRDLFKQYCEDMGWKFYLVDMYVPSDADYYALSEVMKARWDGFKAGRSFIGPPNRAAKSSQRAGVAEDAARYRWLRERRFYKADNPHTSVYHKGGCDTGWLYLKTLDRDGLDAAIDAAIAAPTQQQEG